MRMDIGGVGVAVGIGAGVDMGTDVTVDVVVDCIQSEKKIEVRHGTI